MVKVKICGITNLPDALYSIKAGCDALGFVFYKKSRRYISPQKAKNIIRFLPAGIIKIGVFVNAKAKAIGHIAKSCKLDILQFHGSETPKFCSKFKGYKIIKAFRIKDKLDLQNISRYKTFAYLFDTFEKRKFGGTGMQFNWKLLKNIKDYIKRPVFLSGGINTRNVTGAMNTVHPDWIDVSSAVENKPGKKNHKKIKRFLQIAKNIRI